MRSIVQYRPSRGSLLANWDRAIDSFFNFDDNWLAGRAGTPTVDVHEEDTRYVLEAELPGLSEKDVEVKVDDNLLTISSSTAEDHEEKEGGYIRRERRTLAFTRSFVLPKDVNRAKIEANFKNGLLILSIPKAEDQQPRQIPVQTA